MAVNFVRAILKASVFPPRASTCDWTIVVAVLVGVPTAPKETGVLL